jgi:hypothetical protein
VFILFVIRTIGNYTKKAVRETYYLVDFWFMILLRKK